MTTKRIVALALTICLLLALPTFSFASEGVHVQDAYLSMPQTLYLPVGSSYRVLYTITPLDYDRDFVHWESSNPAVATVDNYGNVQAISIGRAQIRLHCHMWYVGFYLEVTSKNSVLAVGDSSSASPSMATDGTLTAGTQIFTAKGSLPYFSSKGIKIGTVSSKTLFSAGSETNTMQPVRLPDGTKVYVRAGSVTLSGTTLPKAGKLAVAKRNFTLKNADGKKITTIAKGTFVVVIKEMDDSCLVYASFKEGYADPAYLD